MGDTAVLLEGEEGEAKEEEKEEEGEFRLFSFRSPLQEGEEGEEEKEEAMTNNQACAILDGKYVVTNSLMTKLGAETAVFEQNGCSGKYTFFNNENEKLDLWSPNKLYTLTYRVVGNKLTFYGYWWNGKETREKKKQYSADISGSPGSYILTWSNKAVYTQKNADDTAVLLEK